VIIKFKQNPSVCRRDFSQKVPGTGFWILHKWSFPLCDEILRSHRDFMESFFGPFELGAQKYTYNLLRVKFNSGEIQQITIFSYCHRVY
jgi:hypothetical protein